MTPKRNEQGEIVAAAEVMASIKGLPEASQARVLLAVCGWCGFDGAIYGLLRHATGEDPSLIPAVPPTPDRDLS